MGSVLEAMLLGLVQGLTEFLPVSSSGHLALFQRMLGWRDPHGNLSFSIAVHFGSLVAVIAFMRRDLILMLTRRPRLVLLIGLATVPIGIVVMSTEAQAVVAGVARDTVAVGMLLMVTASTLVAAQVKEDADGRTEDLPYWRSFLIGCAQVFALLPGISRSGVTLAAGMGAGLSREQALRFAFLLAIPVIAGATLFEVVSGGFSVRLDIMPVLAGMLVSLIASYVAMKVLVQSVRRRGLGFFAVYCTVAGILAVIWGVS